MASLGNVKVTVDVQLNDESIERIAQRVAELLAPPKVVVSNRGQVLASVPPPTPKHVCTNEDGDGNCYCLPD